MAFCGIGYNKNSISADIAQKKIDSIKHTVTCLQDPTSYQGEKALSAIAGLAIGASALVFVASKFLLPLFGVNIGNIGLLGGLNLTHLLYGAGAVGALTGTAIMASSLARAKEPYQKKIDALTGGTPLEAPIDEKATVTAGMQHFKRNTALFFGGATIIGLPFAALYNAQQIGD